MELKKTISTVFMVPTLGISKETLRENGFINAYEYDDSRDILYPDSVYLLFKPDNFQTFRAFLQEEYDRTTNILDDYDYGKGFVVVVYKLNKKFLPDFSLIREGKYSKTSKPFQALYSKTTKIFKENKYFDEISLQFRIFNKTKDLFDFWEDKLGVKLGKEQEVWEIYDQSREILTTKKLEAYGRTV
jgi:hypothetical protein